MLKKSRLVVAALAAIALVLGGLIYRDVFVGTKNTASSLNLYTVARRTVTSSVTGTGNLVPMQQANVSFNAAYQAAKQTLTTDQAALQTAIDQFNADACKSQAYPYTGACVADFSTVSTDQSKVNADQVSVNGYTVAVNADQTKLSQDTAKQQSDRTSGQRSINQAAASVTSAQDALKTQTESKPNQILSAQAQLASAQAAVQTAQQNLASTTLVAPMDGVVNSINGVVGESAITGSGTTPEAPGTQAPLPTSQASSAFMVIGDVSGMEVVIPFAESDASKLAFNQDTQVTFDAVPNLTISGHLVAVGSAATVQSGVVNYYATVA